MNPPELLHALQEFFKQKGIRVKSIDVKPAGVERTDLQIKWDTTQPNEQPSPKKKASKAKQ